jgi:hypothetical protein
MEIGLKEHVIQYKEIESGNTTYIYEITAMEVEGIGCLVTTSDGITFVHGVQVEETDIKVKGKGNLYKLVSISFK